MENTKEIARYLVIDTSAVIENPDVVTRVRNASVCIPLTVIKQLDGLKKSSDQARSEKARKASFLIEEGIKANHITILTEFDKVDGLDNDSDNKIVGAAVYLKKKNPEAQVALLATDRNMRIVAAGYGVGLLGLSEVELRKMIKFKVPVAAKVFAGLGLAMFLSAFFVSTAAPGFFGLFVLGAIAIVIHGSAYNKQVRNYGGYKIPNGYRRIDEDEQSTEEKNMAAGGSADAKDWIIY